VEHVDYDAIAPVYDRRYERTLPGAGGAPENDFTDIERALVTFVGDHPACRVLEVGCGTGHWLGRLAHHGIADLTGLDRSARMLAIARSKVADADLREGDAGDLPWPDGSFDRVICVHALHHFPDKPAFIAEARRVLRSGGGIFTVGLDPHVGSDRWVVYDFFDGTLEADRRRYPPTGTIRAWLTAAGLTRATTSAAMCTSARMAARIALDSGYLDKHATSQLTLLPDGAYRDGIARIMARVNEAEARGEIFELRADLRQYATVAWIP
jgi:ubiquinone/menaquinone biosynthesis C-methylase UbiE